MTEPTVGLTVFILSLISVFIVGTLVQKWLLCKPGNRLLTQKQPSDSDPYTDAAIHSAVLLAVHKQTASATLTGFSYLADRERLYFTAKHRPQDPDLNAIVLIEENSGLIYANGKPAEDSSLGYIKVLDPHYSTIEVSMPALPALDSAECDITTIIDGSVYTLFRGSVRLISTNQD